MSHFSVLVITPGEPTEETLQAALQPFHEFECTGEDDQYVQDVDVTEEYRTRFAEGSGTRLRLESGVVADPYDDQFYRDPTPEETATRGSMMGSGCGGGISWHSKDWGDGRGYRSKIRFVPDGATEIEIPYSDVMTFAEYCVDNGKPVKRNGESGDYKYGYTLIDASGEVQKVIDRTNPNSKWDWWKVGGRYSGKFVPGCNPDEDPLNKEKCFLCSGTGIRSDAILPGKCNGCEGTGICTKWPSEWFSFGNQIRVCDIPWEALREDEIKADLKSFDKAAEITKGLELPPKWDALRDEIGIDAARDKWNSFESVKALRAAHFWECGEAIEDLKLGREAVQARAARRAVTCWAIIKDGQWYEKGSMGWFGMSSNDKDPEAWTEEVNKLLESLPPDHWITCVDCHI